MNLPFPPSIVVQPGLFQRAIVVIVPGGRPAATVEVWSLGTVDSILNPTEVPAGAIVYAMGSLVLYSSLFIVGTVGIQA